MSVTEKVYKIRQTALVGMARFGNNEYTTDLLDVLDEFERLQTRVKTLEMMLEAYGNEEDPK